MKQKELSVLLRVIVAVCALGALVYAFVTGVTAAKSLILDHNMETAYLLVTVLLVVPFFLAAWDFWQIFTQIGRDNSFCMENALRLRRICFYALIDALLEVVGIGLLGCIGKHDIGGFVAVKLFFVAVALAIAVVCAALSHLTRKAALLKDENDLTI